MLSKGSGSTPLLSAAMIVKTGKGYVVKSEEGKNLGGPYKSIEEAKKRLRQVEYFKHRGAKM